MGKLSRPRGFTLAPKYGAGFTIIEILVVIAIIAILMVLGLFSYQSSMKKARDSRRKADLEQMRTALELYKSDSVTSEYPDALADLEAGDYIASVPTDPKDFIYYYLPDGTTYELCGHLEIDDTSDYCGGLENCGGDCNYRVVNP